MILIFNAKIKGVLMKRIIEWTINSSQNNYYKRDNFNLRLTRLREAHWEQLTRTLATSSHNSIEYVKIRFWMH